MANVLKLQQLGSQSDSSDAGTIFGSTISTICPTRVEGAGDPFQME